MIQRTVQLQVQGPFGLPFLENHPSTHKYILKQWRLSEAICKTAFKGKKCTNVPAQALSHFEIMEV